MTRGHGGGWWTLAAGITLGIGLGGCGPATPTDAPAGGGSSISGQKPTGGIPNKTMAEGGGAGENGAFTAGPKPPQPDEIPAGYPQPGKDQAPGDATPAPKDAGTPPDSGATPAPQPGSTAPASDPGNAAPKSSGDTAPAGGSAKGTDSGAPGSASPSPPASGTPKR